jgi:hypothetical protein
MPALLDQIADFERRLRVLLPRTRGERRELALCALGDVVVLRGYARSNARPLALLLGLIETLDVLDPPLRARGKPRGRPFAPKATDDQVLAGIAKAPTQRAAAADLGVSEATVSRRRRRVRAAGERTCTQ